MPCSRGCCNTSAEHYRSISMAPSATPSRKGGAQAARINEKEKQWATDMRAYKALRAQGLQPPRIDGAAEVQAKAEHPFEVASGVVFEGRKAQASMQAGLDVSAEMGIA